MSRIEQTRQGRVWEPRPTPQPELSDLFWPGWTPPSRAALLSITGCSYSSSRPFLSFGLQVAGCRLRVGRRANQQPTTHNLRGAWCALSTLLLLALACLLCLAACTLFERTVGSGPQVLGPPNQQPTTNNQPTNIVISVNPALSRGLDTAKEVAGLLPSPWGEIATAALGLTSGVLGWIARRKTRMVNAMITGVEAAAVNEQVKVSIQKSATAVGVERTLRRHVK